MVFESTEGFTAGNVTSKIPNSKNYKRFWLTRSNYAIPPTEDFDETWLDQIKTRCNINAFKVSKKKFAFLSIENDEFECIRTLNLTQSFLLPCFVFGSQNRCKCCCCSDVGCSIHWFRKRRITRT